MSARRLVWLWSVTIVALLLSIVLATTTGAVQIPFSAFLRQTEVGPYATILWDIRMPRVLLAGCIGGSLALAGVVFQALLQNPLADPFTIGVSSGASLGAVLTLFFSISLFGSWTLSIFAIVGAFLTLLFVLFFAKIIDVQMRMETVLLIGIMVSSFLSALLSLLIALTNEQLRAIVHWLFGSVSMKGWETLGIFIPFVLLAGWMILPKASALNAFSFGEAEAHIVGVDTKKLKIQLMIASSILVGGAVAFSGVIGFVGLVIPHMTRLVVGANHRYVLPFSFLFGAIFLILVDWVARMLIAPSELPLGVLTSLLGAPLFAYLFWHIRRKEREHLC